MRPAGIDVQAGVAHLDLVGYAAATAGAAQLQGRERRHTHIRDAAPVAPAAADTLGNDAWRIVAMGFDRGCRVRGPAIRATAIIAQADRAAVAAPAGAAAYGHRYARRQREGVAAIAAPSAYGLCQHGGAVLASRRDSAQVIKNHTRAVAASGPGAAHANDAFAVAAAAAAAADRLHDDADGRVAGGRDGSRIAHHHVTAGRPGGTRRIASHAEQARSAARGAASAADGLTHHAV